MTPYQIKELEKLYRLAVRLSVNPASNVAPCEAGCGKVGTEAHHVVKRSQEPGIRWKYEPRWGVLLCHECHMEVEQEPAECILTKLAHRPTKVKRLRRYLDLHDRVKCRDVSFPWMRDYLKRCCARLESHWSSAYCDGV